MSRDRGGSETIVPPETNERGATWDPWGGRHDAPAEEVDMSPSAQEAHDAARAPRVEQPVVNPGHAAARAAARLQAADTQRESLATILTLAQASSWPHDVPGKLSVIKQARRRAHPDANGGCRADWDRLEAALTAISARDLGR